MSGNSKRIDLKLVETSQRRSRKRRRGSFLWALAIVCAMIGLLVIFLENRLIYYPTPYPEGFWDTAELSRKSGCLVEDRFFSSEDGVDLHGWWCRPAEEKQNLPTADLVLLWLHGNAGNLSHRGEAMLALAGLPATVFIVDYRGYGRSAGKPSEEGLYRDAWAAWRYLTQEKGIAPERIVIFGISLGGAVAVDLATQVKPAGLIVQSSFTSIRDMAAHHFPIVPGFLISTRLDSLAKIAEVDCRKLFIHSPADEIVPYDLGRILFEAAPEPKKFHEVPGAGHNETFIIGGSYFVALAEFLKSCTGKHRDG